MKIALINPKWSFERSIYFGCREPHLPLEFGYSRMLLEDAGHRVILIDGGLEDLTDQAIAERIQSFSPDMTVITTANSYLFWRCAQPELRVPASLIEHIQDSTGMIVAVGPHSSTTPAAALRKLNADVVVIGECEEPLLKLADRTSLQNVPSICFVSKGETVVQGGPNVSDMKALPAIRWEPKFINRHNHHHHRFDKRPDGPGAEMEFSRGCPYHCTFCAKENFRNSYRKRPLEIVLDELDGLLKNEVRYIYFIDEIFLPDYELLEALVSRGIEFGIQTRIDLWKKEMLDLLADAGCVSIEAGIESITPEGRSELDKNCKLSTEELADRLIYAKGRIPFVQANLLECEYDDLESIEKWRHQLRQHGVWANEPVPLFPYPGSPEYTRRWGPPDELAWERASDFYLNAYSHFSDIQDQLPLELEELEGSIR